MTSESASNPAAVRRARIAAQGIGARGRTPTEVVRHMLAVQGQDLGQTRWAIGVRSLGLTRADVDGAFDRGEILRSWPMRGTLHTIAPDDLRALLSLTAERTIRATTRRREQLGLDDATIDRAHDTAVAALSGGRALPRDGMLEAFRTAGLDTAAGRGYHLLFHLSQRGLIAWGPNAESGQSVVLLDEWAPATAAVPDREAALLLALTGYLRGRGPATLADFVSWTKLTLGDARVALAAAGDAIVPVDATRYALVDAPVPGGVASAHLLPGFDEYLLGYADRSAVIDDDLFERVVPGSNGIFLPMVVVRGRVVGTWKRAGSGARTRVAVTPFAPLTEADRRAVAAAAERHAAFAGTGADVEYA